MKFESIIAACKLPITFTHSGKNLEVVFFFVREVCEAGVSVEGGGGGVGGRMWLWRAGWGWVKWGRAGWQLFPHLQVQSYPTWSGCKALVSGSSWGLMYIDTFARTLT